MTKKTTDAQEQRQLRARPTARTGTITARYAPEGTFARALSDLREAHGLTRAEMARELTRVGEGRVYIGAFCTRAEGSGAAVTEGTVRLYARALGVEPVLTFRVRRTA